MIRALATGGEVAAFDGSDQTFGLKFRGTSLPVFVGAIGPKTLRLAGEIADGIVLSLGTTPEAAATAVRTAGSAERAPGLDTAVHTVCYVAFGGLDDDAAERMQPFAAHLLAACAARPAFGVLLEGTGVDAEGAGRLAAAYQAGTPLPAELVAGMTLAGSLEHCIERVAAYRAAGVDEIALGMGRWNTSLAETLADAGQLVAAVRAS